MDFVLTPLMAVHILMMNVACGGPMVCIWLEYRAGKGCAAAQQACPTLSLDSFKALLVGGVIGAVVFVLLWDDAYKAAFSSMSSKIGYGVIEYFFSLALMGLHAFTWRKPAKSMSMTLFRCFVLLLAGTNLLYHFPFLFLILGNAATGLLNSAGEIDAAVFRTLMVEGDVLPRAIHFIVACFAVTGVWMFSRTRHLEDEKIRDQVIGWGGKLALTPTLLQILVGLWIIIRLPRPALRSLMGTDIAATTCLIVSVLLAFWLMHLLSMVALGKSNKKGRGKAALVLGTVVLLMCGVVQRIKHYGEPVVAVEAESPDEHGGE